MAEPKERSLDDFFAKRDKKKKKEKGGVAASSAAASRGAARPSDGSQSTLVSLSSGGPKNVRKDKAPRTEAQERQYQEKKVSCQIPGTAQRRHREFHSQQYTWEMACHCHMCAAYLGHRPLAAARPAASVMNAFTRVPPLPPSDWSM